MGPKTTARSLTVGADSQRDGFSLLELVIVIMISSMLMGVGARSYSQVSNQRSVGNARDAMVEVGFRARSEAMRSGQTVFMEIRPADDLVQISLPGGEVLHTLNSSEYGADMIGADMTLCYTSRGYALPGCTTVKTVAGLGFVRGLDTASVQIMPLGQVRRAP